VIIALAVFLCGCGGREAHPIALYLQGDQNKSCDQLLYEFEQLSRQYKKKKQQHSEKEAADILLFVVLVPWFFMDLKDAEKVEYEAMAARMSVIKSLARQKGCDFIQVMDQAQKD
jgi:outer membrane PBP1 activator LpoA protein